MCTKRRRKFSKDSPKMPKASGSTRSGWRRWLQKCFKITKKERKNWIKQSFYSVFRGQLNMPKFLDVPQWYDESGILRYSSPKLWMHLLVFFTVGANSSVLPVELIKIDSNSSNYTTLANWPSGNCLCVCTNIGGITPENQYRHPAWASPNGSGSSRTVTIYCYARGTDDEQQTLTVSHYGATAQYYRTIEIL